MGKIKILWIVNDKYVNNFITVYKECKNSSKFEMSVMATDRLGYDFSPAITCEEVYSYLSENGVESFKCRKNGKYFDISEISPDYIFTTTPYDIYLPKPFRSDALVKFGKLCHVDYGAVLIRWINDYASIGESDYYKNAQFIFHCDPREGDNIPANSVSIGNLKLDEYLYYGRKPESPFYKSKDSFKIVWKPRWTMKEGDSTLYPYLDKFYGFLKERENAELVLLLHQMAEVNLEKKGYGDYFRENMEKLKTLPNFTVTDSSDFLDTVLGADLLIADHTSLIAEFTVTGKPIIYTTPAVALSPLGEKIIKNSYIANNFEELEKIADGLIRKEPSADPKSEQRLKDKDSYFVSSKENLSVAKRLLEFLEKDFSDISSYKRYSEIKSNTYKKEISALEDEIKSKDALIEGKNGEIEQAKSKISGLENTVSEKLKENAILSARVSKIDGYINKIPKFLRSIFKKFT